LHRCAQHDWPIMEWKINVKHRCCLCTR